KLGEVQTSYQMVEKPAQESVLPSAAQEAKPARQQAAVRGITPSQPAPVREQKPQPEPEQLSFLDKIFSWFKQISGEEKRVQPEQSTISPQRTERGRGRRDRGREGRDSEYNEKAPRSNQRGRDERGAESSDVLSQARDATPQRPIRGEPKTQGERSAQKKPRAPREEKIRTENKLLTGEEQPAMEDAFQQGEDGGRRRRRGGRQRDRGERSERVPREGKQATVRDSQSEQAVNSATHEESLLPVTAIPTPIQEAPALISAASPAQAIAVLSEPEVASPPASLQITEITPAVPEQATLAGPAEPASALPVEPEAELDKQQPVQEPAATNAPAAPVTATLEPPQVEVARTEDSIPAAAIEVTSASESQESLQLMSPHEPPDLVASGLVMIETIPEKIKPIEADVAGESALAERRRKRPPPAPVVEHDEPLVQIETHK
ncbi:MAG: ribonuclease E/G, partial [Nitrosospira sp.]